MAIAVVTDPAKPKTNALASTANNDSEIEIEGVEKFQKLLMTSYVLLNIKTY